MSREYETCSRDIGVSGRKVSEHRVLDVLEWAITKLQNVELYGEFFRLIPLQKKYAAALYQAGRNDLIWTY